MIEGVDFTMSYAPVAVISSLRIIVEIYSVEGIILFVLDISNDFHNTISPKSAERVNLSLPYLYLDLYKRKWPKTSISLNESEIIMHTIIQVN